MTAHHSTQHHTVAATYFSCRHVFLVEFLDADLTYSEANVAKRYFVDRFWNNERAAADLRYLNIVTAATFAVAVASLAVRCKNLTIASGNHGSPWIPSWSCTTSAFCQWCTDQNAGLYLELTPERSTHWISGAWGGSLIYAGTTAFPTVKCGA